MKKSAGAKALFMPGFEIAILENQPTGFCGRIVTVRAE
jgi:hypothetical protein